MVATRASFIVIFLSIQFYISIQGAVQQPADILGDNSLANKRHNRIDKVRNMKNICTSHLSDSGIVTKKIVLSPDFIFHL